MFRFDIAHRFGRTTVPRNAAGTSSRGRDDNDLEGDALHTYYLTPHYPVCSLCCFNFGLVKVCEQNGLVPVGIYFGSDHYKDDRVYPHAEVCCVRHRGLVAMRLIFPYILYHLCAKSRLRPTSGAEEPP